MHGLQPCGALVACGRRLFLQAISPPFLVVSSSTKKHTISGVFFLMRAKFFAHICTISLKLCVEPVVCARCLFLQAIPHLRLPSELSRQTSRRYGVPFFVCVPHTTAKTLLAGSISSKALFVLVFQLEDIVDFPLIHRPYGFIVQFLMINTGNGGSFVQL